MGKALEVVLLPLARHQGNLLKEFIEPAADHLPTFKYRSVPETIAKLKNKHRSLHDFTFLFRGEQYQVATRGHIISPGTYFRDAIQNACGQAAGGTRVEKIGGGHGNCVTRLHPYSNR